MPSAYADVFHQRCHVAPFVSSDARGVPTHGTPVAWPCRYQPTDRLARDKDGDERVAEGVLYTEAPVTTRDLVWPPGADPADVGASKLPISVAPRYDLESGALDHYQVTL